MIGSHFTLVQVAERLHRHFLDVLRIEITRHNITDINAVEALLLANIADDDVSTDQLPERGYYAGNVKDSVRGLIERGYLSELPNMNGALRLHLAPKGQEFYATIRALQEHLSHELERGGLTPETVFQSIDTLEMVERTWDSYVRFYRQA